MSKIQILDKIITNRIAAGEVVERPASVIKELFENSIDAGADKILIEIEEGGTKSISITDNGGGIEFNDVKTAFLPHSTSKIKNLEDLENIATLGFRGEALASIASVSQVEIITKTKNNLVAAK
ncbi:MAG: DNA mismatch repair endonuclease MutL, partial [Clostridia bacterium]|nr:DNA mismatch repair endonuclease MutL [Clostridia bacterium]